LLNATDCSLQAVSGAFFCYLQNIPIQRVASSTAPLTIDNIAVKFADGLVKELNPI